MSAYETGTLIKPGDYTAWMPGDGSFRVFLSGMNEYDTVALERSLDGGATGKRLRVFTEDQDGTVVGGAPGQWYRLVLVSNADGRNIDAKVSREGF